jgi:7,8-dihydropterin-6-yl-methyl-4-(beta-D-ribofuranosyl)aminobenzene 5'-phosphate synthase
MKLLTTVLIAAGISSLTSIAAPARAAAPESKSQITILYDAFGTDPSMTKDWGFSALVEVVASPRKAEIRGCGSKGLPPQVSP